MPLWLLEDPPGSLGERSRNRQYETMTKRRVGLYTVRVWCTTEEFTMGPDDGVLAVLSSTHRFDFDRSCIATPEVILQALERFERVAAVEILDDHGNGGLLYPDWK